MLIDEGSHFNEAPEWTHLEKNLDSHLTLQLMQSGAISGIRYQSPERLSAHTHTHTHAHVCVCAVTIAFPTQLNVFSLPLICV